MPAARTIAELRHELREARQALDAIRSGGVDAVVVHAREGERFYVLETAEQPYRLLVEQMQQGAVVAANDGLVLYTNPLFTTLVAPREPVVGTPFDSLFGVTERPAVRRLLEAARSRPVTLEAHLQGAAGRTLPVLLSGSPLRSAGAAVGICLLVTDLTDRHRFESLEATERTFRVLADSSPVPIWVTDVAGAFLFVNRAFRGFFGTTLDAIARAGWDPLLHPDDAAPFRSALREALACRTELRTECRVRRADGEWRHIASFGAPWYSDEGELLGYVGSSPDITDLKRTEQALRRSEERYRLASESMQGVVYDWEVGKGTIARSCGLRELLGHTTDGAPSDPDWWLLQIAAEDRARYQARVDAAFAERNAAFDLEYRVRHREGRFVWVWDHGRVLYDDAGAASRVIGCIISVDAQKRLEEALLRADRQKDQFLATLAHELRNPLAPIRNAVAILRVKSPALPELEWSRDLIERQVAHMSRLLDDLLDVARITQSKLQLRRERVEVRAIIEAAVETARPLVEERRHALAVTLPPQPVYLDADLVRLSQAVANLLNNAAKYTNPGGRLSLSVEARDDEVAISMRDDGIGIASEALSDVFRMFSQAPSSLDRAQGGLGIGLSLVRGLVELHGGTVEGRSEGLGRGSEFVVRLPIATPPLPRPAPNPGEPPARAGVRLRVLVADDNQDTAETLALVLSLQGHEVRTAFDGDQAFAVAEAFHPDVALLDVGMPKASGHAVARRIREQPWGERMTLVAQTGWGQDDDLRRTREAGFDHHLVKPVPPSVVTELLAGLRPASGSVR